MAYTAHSSVATIHNALAFNHSAIPLPFFSYNNKVYKTEAAMKKAKTMDVKRLIKQVKKEAYAVSEKKQKREATIDYKKIINQNQKIELFSLSL